MHIVIGLLLLLVLKFLESRKRTRTRMIKRKLQTPVLLERGTGVRPAPPLCLWGAGARVNRIKMSKIQRIDATRKVRAIG